ncbi:MAG: ATP-binding protein [Chloroflexota bacterium]
MIRVPDVLASHSEDAEALYTALHQATSTHLNMADVSFIRPHGVIALVCAARARYAEHGERTVLCNLQHRVHQYLERVDLFRAMGDFITTESTLHDTFDRTQEKPTLLELTPISSAGDLLTAIAQAERIFSYWLQVRNLRGLLGVVSELCSNIYQHSGDPHGAVMIQTHRAVTKGAARVRVAIGDTRLGVRGSLENRHGTLGETPLDYLMIAMGGRTSRETGRGGLGLRIVEQTVGAGGGYMWLRSENAAVLTGGPGTVQTRDHLAYVPGTQVAVEFHAPLD